VVRDGRSVSGEGVAPAFLLLERCVAERLVEASENPRIQPPCGTKPISTLRDQGRSDAEHAADVFSPTVPPGTLYR
jgi:hypothetical protein